MNPAASRLLRTAGLFALFGMVNACAKQSAPPKHGFELDPDPLPLTDVCVTEGVEGCETLGQLSARQAELLQLHDTQMAEIDAALQPLVDLLNRPESLPAAVIEAEEIDTDKWLDPDGAYPVSLVVRLEHKAGLERLGEGTREQFEKAVQQASSTWETLEDTWSKAISSHATAVPNQLVAERQTAQIVVTAVGPGPQIPSVKPIPFDATFSLPKHIALSRLARDVPQWQGVASHVITKHSLEQVALQEHRFSIQPALEISAVDDGSMATVTIAETPGTRQRLSFESEIQAADFCENLRGELRFVPANQVIPMKAVFSSVEDSGGAR